MATVTPRLERAFARAAQLPAAEQDALAAVMLAEMEEARHWDDALAQPRSLLLLEQLASAALAEDEAGLTEPLERTLQDAADHDQDQHRG